MRIGGYVEKETINRPSLVRSLICFIPIDTFVCKLLLSSNSPICIQDYGTRIERRFDSYPHSIEDGYLNSLEGNTFTVLIQYNFDSLIIMSNFEVVNIGPSTKFFGDYSPLPFGHGSKLGKHPSCVMVSYTLTLKTIPIEMQLLTAYSSHGLLCSKLGFIYTSP